MAAIMAAAEHWGKADMAAKKTRSLLSYCTEYEDVKTIPNPYYAGKDVSGRCFRWRWWWLCLASLRSPLPRWSRGAGSKLWTPSRRVTAADGVVFLRECPLIVWPG